MAIFPTDGKSKLPLIKGWPREASSDPHQIRQWWEKSPEAGIGLLCGNQSGVAVIDLDAKNVDANGLTGVDHYIRLREQHGGIGDCLIADTPSGGSHLFVRYESVPFEKSESRVAFGIDVRSAKRDGSGAGYVQLAPHERQWRPVPLAAFSPAEGP
jgi:putative DNA primase/helicase